MRGHLEIEEVDGQESVLRGILFREECAHVDRPQLTLI